MDPSTFVDQASSKEKTVGNNRFQDEINVLSERLNNTLKTLSDKNHELDTKNSDIVELKIVIQKLKDEIVIQQKAQENMISRLNYNIESHLAANKNIQKEKVKSNFFYIF